MSIEQRIEPCGAGITIFTLSAKGNVLKDKQSINMSPTGGDAMPELEDGSDSMLRWILWGWSSLRGMTTEMDAISSRLTTLYGLRTREEFIAELLSLLELCIDTGGRTGGRRGSQYLRVISCLDELLAEDFDQVRDEVATVLGPDEEVA